jgi:glutamate carboxypeptidase
VSVQAVRASLADRLTANLDLLAELVNVDSPSGDREGVGAVLARLADPAERLGARLDWRDENGVPHLRATFEGGAQRVALLGHADTVFAQGTAALRPFRTDDGMAHGPGVADMKGGLVVALAALERLFDLDADRPTLELVVVGDEEERLVPPPFMDILGGCDACLVLEAAARDGGFVVGRKAGAWTRLVSQGRAAHSGTEPERGSSAILALCRELLRIADINGMRPALTLSVGKVSGGSMTNVVPELAEAALDVRSPEPADLDAAIAEARTFGTYPGVRLILEEEGRWPAMRPSPATLGLASTYETLAREAGVSAPREWRGGMSDGCWVAATGVPTLDGLGPVGGFDHAPDEFIEILSISERAALLVELLVAIGAHGIQPVGRKVDHA